MKHVKKHKSAVVYIFCNMYFYIYHSSSAPVVKSRKALHANLPELHSITDILQRISPQVQNTNIEKYISMAASKGNYF